MPKKLLDFVQNEVDHDLAFFCNELLPLKSQVYFCSSGPLP